MRHNLITLFTLFLLATSLTGCNGDQSIRDLREHIAELKKNEAMKQSKITLPLMKLPPATTYTATGLRAPVEGAKPIVINRQTTTTNPLQAYPMSVLRFVGTVTKDGTVIAYIMTPDNMIYQVKQGDFLGDHQGKVTAIETSRVSVTEQNTEPGKSGLNRVVTLQLKDTQQ